MMTTTKLAAHNVVAKRKLGDEIPAIVKILSYILTSLFALACVLPLIMVVSVSVTDEVTLRLNGYSIIPAKFSFAAYKYIFTNSGQVLQSYLVTIASTVSGVALGLVLMSSLAYVISRDNFAYRKQFTFLIFFTMLFSGGMLSSYIINTNVLKLRDTFAALVLPACVSPMYVMILKSYMRTNIPLSVVESAKMDGASEIRCYMSIVLPMALPSIATIALFMTINYWNSWYHAFLYVRRNTLIPIQLLINRIEKEIQYLAQAGGGGSAMLTMQEDIPSESVKMALVVVIVVPILIAYPFFQRFFVKGITLGAVKE